MIVTQSQTALIDYVKEISFQDVEGEKYLKQEGIVKGKNIFFLIYTRFKRRGVWSLHENRDITEKRSKASKNKTENRGETSSHRVHQEFNQSLVQRANIAFLRELGDQNKSNGLM